MHQFHWFYVRKLIIYVSPYNYTVLYIRCWNLFAINCISQLKYANESTSFSIIELVCSYFFIETTHWISMLQVKTISKKGIVKTLDWNAIYEAIENYLNLPPIGFVMMEAVLYSATQQTWYFLPRSLHRAPNDSSTCSFVVVSTNNFSSFKTISLEGKLDTRSGFAAARFVPGTNETAIMALRSLEGDRVFATMIVVFHINSTILLPEQTVSQGVKFEGVEFMWTRTIHNH